MVVEVVDPYCKDVYQAAVLLWQIQTADMAAVETDAYAKQVLMAASNGGAAEPQMHALGWVFELAKQME